jgi:hypothetical protein
MTADTGIESAIKELLQPWAYSGQRCSSILGQQSDRNGRLLLNSWDRNAKSDIGYNSACAEISVGRVGDFIGIFDRVKLFKDMTVRGSHRQILQVVSLFFG